MDAIANIMNLFIFVFCILFVNIDKTVVCTSVKSIKSLSLSLSLNGVKQGGITSPLFFCVYINDLLNLLESKGIGCYIGPE